MEREESVCGGGQAQADRLRVSALSDLPLGSVSDRCEQTYQPGSTAGFVSAVFCSKASRRKRERERLRDRDRERARESMREGEREGET